MDINIELNLFSAGKIALPLKAQVGSTLNPQPNFLIIENILTTLQLNFQMPKEFLKTQSAKTLT